MSEEPFSPKCQFSTKNRGISKSGLARLIADGKIRPMKAFKRNRLFAMVDVRELLSDTK